MQELRGRIEIVSPETFRDSVFSMEGRWVEEHSRRFSSEFDGSRKRCFGNLFCFQVIFFANFHSEIFCIWELKP
jgi:hypothetical protein